MILYVQRHTGLSSVVSFVLDFRPLGRFPAAFTPPSCMTIYDNTPSRLHYTQAGHGQALACLPRLSPFFVFPEEFVLGTPLVRAPTREEVLGRSSLGRPVHPIDDEEP
jgi:hypothetical protein